MLSNRDTNENYVYHKDKNILYALRDKYQYRFIKINKKTILNYIMLNYINNSSKCNNINVMIENIGI